MRELGPLKRFTGAFAEELGKWTARILIASVIVFAGGNIYLLL